MGVFLVGSFDKESRTKKEDLLCTSTYLKFFIIYSPDCGLISQIVHDSSTQEMFAHTDILAHTLSSEDILDGDWLEASDPVMFKSVILPTNSN